MRAVVATAAVLIVVLLGGASPAAAETDLEVTTPADGRYVPGQPTPLVVTIAADRAVSGTLTASFDGILGGSVPVEVPGGSTKEVVLIVTTPPWGSGGTLSFDADDAEDDASTRLNLQQNWGDELIAVFPELSAAQLPATAELRAEVGQARLFAFDPDLLTNGPDVLSPFSHVVVTAGDLNQLDQDGLDALTAWVGGDSGRLVVDEPASSPLPLDVGAADDDGEAALGTGAVIFTDGALARTGYDGAFAPTMTRSADEFPNSGFGGMPASLTLARDAGVAVPEITLLLILLAIYILVIGPVLWLLLRRVRREPLLWLILPVGALLTTLGVYGIGLALRNDATAAHATVVADLPNLQAVSTQVLVTSSNGGTAGIELPDGWRVRQVFDEAMWFEGGFGVEPGGRPVVADGELVTDLPPGGTSVLAAEATLPAATDSSWSIDLVGDGEGGLTGTITNLTDRTLVDGFVAAGQGYQQVRELGPGESMDVTLRNANVPVLESDRLAESMWRFDPWEGDLDGTAANPGVLLEFLATRPELRTPGFVLVGGWTRDEDGPLATADGRTVTNGRTLFVTADRVADLGGEPYRLELLRGWNSTQVVDFDPNRCGAYPVTLRLAVTDPDALGGEPVLDLSRRGVAALDIWTGSWEPAGIAQAANDRIIMAVPPAALVDDELYLRVQVGCDAFQFANPFPDLRAATDEDEVLTIGALDEATVALDDDLEPAEGSAFTTTTGPGEAVDEPADGVTTTAGPDDATEDVDRAVTTTVPATVTSE
ncbi:MAG: hypothetical protein AAGA59_04940 [Actinomycetota bacterium]